MTRRRKLNQYGNSNLVTAEEICKNMPSEYSKIYIKVLKDNLNIGGQFPWINAGKIYTKVKDNLFKVENL